MSSWIDREPFGCLPGSARWDLKRAAERVAATPIEAVRLPAALRKYL